MSRSPMIAEIKEAVAAEFELTVADLEGLDRHWEFTIPRHIAFRLCRELTRHSLPRIGNVFGRRDHTSVISGIRNLDKKFAKQPELQGRFDAIVERLQLATPNSNEGENDGRDEVPGHGPAAEEERRADRPADDARQG